MKSFKALLGYWWISWFGIFGGFFMIGIGQYRYQSAAARHFSLALMAIIGLSWLAFWVADSKVDRERTKSEVDLLTLMGTLLAVFTLLGIAFMAVIAPRIP